MLFIFDVKGTKTALTGATVHLTHLPYTFVQKTIWTNSEGCVPRWGELTIGHKETWGADERTLGHPYLSLWDQGTCKVHPLSYPHPLTPGREQGLALPRADLLGFAASISGPVSREPSRGKHPEGSSWLSIPYLLLPQVFSGSHPTFVCSDMKSGHRC